MATMIIPQAIKNVDNEVMQRLSRLIDYDLLFDLEMACNLRVGRALEDGFKIGWDMRGKV